MKLQILAKTASEDKNSVYVIYRGENLVDFTVRWDRDEDNNFDLAIDVMAEQTEYAQRVREAILAGEDDSSENVDLYLAVRDTFDALDCVGLAGEIND